MKLFKKGKTVILTIVFITSLCYTGFASNEMENVFKLNNGNAISECYHNILYNFSEWLMLVAIVLLLVAVVIIIFLCKTNKRLSDAKRELEIYGKKYAMVTKSKTEHFFEVDLANDTIHFLNHEDIGGKTMTFTEMPFSLLKANTIAEESVKDYLDYYDKLKRGDESVSVDIRCSFVGEDFEWYNAFATRVFEDKNQTWAVGTLENINEKKQRETELNKKAKIDQLTKIYNRAAIEELIEDALNVASCSAFIMYDLDEFKLINDTYGHPAGDRILVKTAEILKICFRSSDIIGRIGGDEFVVFAIGIEDKEIAFKKAEESIRQLEKFKEELGWQENISASYGIAMTFEDGTTFKELYEKADLNMYESKQKRKLKLERN